MIPPLSKKRGPNGGFADEKARAALPQITLAKAGRELLQGIAFLFAILSRIPAQVQSILN